jgi:hypothetical protein
MPKDQMTRRRAAAWTSLPRMAVMRREVLGGVRLVAVAGLVTTILSCGHTDSAGHPRHATPAAVAPWRVVPSVRVGCGRRGARPSTTLLAVAATGPDDAWATGSCDPYPDERGGPVGVVEHWDGEKWRRVAAPPDSSYGSVVALSKKEAWAAGEHGLIRWDGRRWTKVPRGLPADAGYRSLLSATSARNVFAIVTTGLGEQDVLVRWGGDRWHDVPPPHGCRFPGDGDEGDLTAGPPQDVWTDFLFCSTFPDNSIWHYDGRRWKALPPPPLGLHWNPDGITVDGQDTLVTVASDEPDQDGVTRTYRWTAGTWRQLPDPHGYARRGMVGDGHGGIWAIGAAAEPYEHPHNRIRHWDGRRWSDRALPAPADARTADLRALAHVPGTAAVWGVGADSGGRPLIEVSGPL